MEVKGAVLANVLLELENVSSAYGQVKVLESVSLTVEQGEVVCLLGRNGAGKTTAIRTINGLLNPTGGAIRFAGIEIGRASPMKVVGLGIATVPEGRHVFPSLTVRENLLAGAYARRRGFILRADISEVCDLFPRLRERLTQLAGTLSGGEQQMLAMGRALMARPKLLLLDEPSMGLAPMVIETVFDTVDHLARQGVTILLVEQNASAALAIADRAYVLERGRIVRVGKSSEMIGDPEVQRAYLGALA